MLTMFVNKYHFGNKSNVESNTIVHYIPSSMN